MARDDDYEDDRPRDSGSGAGAAAAGVSIAVIIVAVVGVGGLCVIGVLIALLLPAVQKVRSAAARMSAQNNLKQIALAMHNYESTYGRLPPPWTTTQDGKPGMSWRVMILPYIEQDNLYRMYQQQEAWDSPNNVGVSSVVIKTYCHPGDPPSNMTRLRVFVGGGAPFDPNKKTIFAGARNPDEIDFRDGLSNTFLVVEAGEMVPWASPRELEYSPNRPLPPLGQPNFGGDFQAAMGDGSVRNISRGTPEPTIRALITSGGGEAVPGF